MIKDYDQCDNELAIETDFPGALQALVDLLNSRCSLPEWTLDVLMESASFYADGPALGASDIYAQWSYMWDGQIWKKIR